MMADLLGFFSIALIYLITLIISIKHPPVSKILFTALTIRVFVMLLGHYLVILPDSNYDAVSFENKAWIWSQNGFMNNLSNYPGAGPYFMSWVIAIPYSLFGRSLLMAKSIGLFLSVGYVFLSWLLTKKLWNVDAANKAGWAIALFPTLIMYSGLIMREVYVYFFLLLGMIGIVNWIKTQSYKSVLLLIFGFTGATFFHGALFVGAIIFAIIILYQSFKKTFRLIMKNYISFQSSILIFSTFSILYLYLNDILYIPYLGNFSEMISADVFQIAMKGRLMGDAAYPDWTIINSFNEIFYKAPIRALYFIFSPFLWEISKLPHLIGVFDSILYMLLTYLIFCNRKEIWNDESLRTILLILICYIFVFGIGVSNFGAGIRHRSKFVIEMIILAAPLIPRLILFKNQKKN